jgi:hypothetical protein
MGPEFFNEVERILKNDLNDSLKFHFNKNIFYILKSFEAIRMAHRHSPQKTLALFSELDYELTFLNIFFGNDDSVSESEKIGIHPTHTNHFLESFLNIKTHLKIPHNLENIWVQNFNPEHIVFLLSHLPANVRSKRLPEFSRIYQFQNTNSLLYDGMLLLESIRSWPIADQIAAIEQIAKIWSDLNVEDINEFYVSLSQLESLNKIWMPIKPQSTDDTQQSIDSVLKSVESKLLQKEAERLYEYELQMSRQKFANLHYKEKIENLKVAQE